MIPQKTVSKKFLHIIRISEIQKCFKFLKILTILKINIKLENFSIILIFDSLNLLGTVIFVSRYIIALKFNVTH